MRRRLPFSRTLLVLTAGLVAAAAAILGLGRMDRVVVARGRLAGGTVPLFAPLDGVVGAVVVEPGDRVAAGDVLLRLAAEDERALLLAEEEHVAALEARLEVLTRREERLGGDVLASELAEAERDVRRSELRLAGAEHRAEAMGALDERGLVANLERHEAELQRNLARVDLEEAREEGPRRELDLETIALELRTERSAVEGELAEARGRRAELARKVELAAVRAPEEGVFLLEPGRELAGRAVARGDELARLAVAAPSRFEGVVRDLGRPHLHAGLPVRVRLDAYPWLLHGSVPGTLERVSERHGADGGFPAVVALAPGGELGPLYDGMEGQARIVVEGGVSIARVLFEELVGRDEP